jgi:2-keto-4-pentenoate hydratase
MTDKKIEAAADILIAVRNGGPQVATLGDAAPTSEAEAWAVQREVLQRLGGTIGGYKCAAPPGKATSAAIMAASGIRRGPTKWAVPAGQQIGVEGEIAVRLKHGLPPRGTPYTLDEVLDAVDAVFPAIELVKSRFLDTSKISGDEAMADNVAHAGFVYGADVADWRGLDLKSLKVRQVCGGQVQVEKTGGNPSGDPLVPLLWIANHLHELGLSLQAGQIVTTGSCTGLTYVDSNQRVTVGFEGLGEVSVDLA